MIELTGAPFAASAPVIGAAPRWDTLIVGLDWNTAILDDRLRRRTEAMFGHGLVDEVRTSRWPACAGGDGRAGAGVRAGARGPRRRFGRPRGRGTTFVGTRRYVRRQRSWFRRDHRVRWLDGAAGDLLSATVAAWRHVS